jgi:rhodanese-related sulfurtransferase
MPPTKGVRELVAAAQATITTLATDDALARHRAGDAGTVFVDIRDVRELDRDGMVPGAIHAPRGMLEFWFDPDSPYYREALGDPTRTYVLYCASAWRSALAAKTLGDMGFTNIAHVEGGFAGWKKAGGPVAERRKETA